MVLRANVSESLAFVRKGQSRCGKTLNQGGIKLYHQTLKTYFNYVGETYDISVTWKNPVIVIKLKGSHPQILEYSDAEIKQMFKTIDFGTDALQPFPLVYTGLRSREMCILTSA